MQNSEALEQTENGKPESEQAVGVELVASLMRQQDDVINQLDELNARIEAMIDDLSAQRKAEQEAAEKAAGVDSASGNSSTDSNVVEVRRAA